MIIESALINEPKLLIADEPTTALDVTIQAQVLGIIASLARAWTLGALHLARSFSRLSKRVMYRGRIVEQAPAAEVPDKPRYPHTLRLIVAAKAEG